MGGLYSVKNNVLTVGKQTAWGTKKEPDTFLEVASFSGGLEYDTVESQILTGSRNSNGSIQVGKRGKISLNTEATTSNIGVLLKGALGSEVVTSLGSGLHQHDFSMLNSAQLPVWTFRKFEGGWRSRDCVDVVLNSMSFDVSPKAIVQAQAEGLYRTEIDNAITCTADATANTLEAVAHGLVNTDQVKFFRVGSGVLPAPIDSAVTYFVVNKTTDDFQVSLTSGGSAVDLSTAGSGTFQAVKQNALTAPTQRPFIYNDGSAKIDGVSFGEIKNVSFQIGNNLNAEDLRLGGGGEISSLSAGKFDLSGSASIMLNEDSQGLIDMINANDDFAFEITLDTGITLGAGTYKLVLTLSTCRFKNISVEADGDFMSLKADFSAITNTPCTVSLFNNKATAY